MVDPVRRRLRPLSALLLALCCLLPVAPGATGATQEDAAAPSAERAASPDSPRAAIRTFLEALVDLDDPGAAAAVFADPPSAHAARQLAEDLKFLLDRTAYVEYARFPAAGSPKLEGATSWTWSASPQDHPELVLEIEFRRGEDGWRIAEPTALTAADLRRTWVREAVPIVSEVEQPGALTVAEVLRQRFVPAGLQREGFVIEHWQWLGLLVLLFLAVVAERLTRVVARLGVRRVAGREKGLLGEDDVANFVRPVGILVAAVVFQLLLHLLDIREDVERILVVASGFAATVAGVWAAYTLVDVFCGFLEHKAARSQNKFDDVLVPLLRRTLKIFVIVVGLVYLASLWAEDLWGLVAGLGLGSLALGLAAKDSIENLFGTFTVLLDKPFLLGDWITVDDIDGTVEEVGFRSTRVRTFYNSLITVPNRRFITSDVDNWGARRYRRIKTFLSLTYDTPPEKIDAFCEGVRELIRGHPYTRKDSFHVYLNQFGASSLDVLLYCFVETPDWSTELRERHRLFHDILQLAERLEVDFAFPTQTLHVVREEAAVHPDRPASREEGSERGRERGQKVVEESVGAFGEERPRPVVIDPREARPWKPPRPGKA